MSTVIFYAIIFILVADFIWERALSLLNIKASKSTIPALLTGLYDEEKYKKQLTELSQKNHTDYSELYSQLTNILAQMLEKMNLPLSLVMLIH